MSPDSKFAVIVIRPPFVPRSIAVISFASKDSYIFPIEEPKAAYEDLEEGSKINTGAVYVIYGSKAGLSLEKAQLWTQDSPWVYDIVESEDLFGSALATGDFSNDRYDDLAVGELYYNDVQGRVQIIDKK